MIEMRDAVVAMLQAASQEPGTALADWQIVKNRRNLSDRCILVEPLRETTVAEDGDVITVEGRLQLTVLYQVNTQKGDWEDAEIGVEQTARALRAKIQEDPTLGGLTRWPHETIFEEKTYGTTAPEWGEREAIRMILKALYAYKSTEILAI